MNVCEFHFTARPTDTDVLPAAEPEALPALHPQYELGLEVHRPDASTDTENAKGMFSGWNFSADAGDCLELRDALYRIQGGTCEEEDLILTGSQLWDAVVQPGGEIEALLRKWRKQHDGMIHLRLTLPPELHDLPWETSHDRELDGHLALDKRHTILRDLVDHPAPSAAPTGNPLQVLLVVPGGSRLDARTEEARLREAIKFAGLAQSVKLETAGNSVSVDDLKDKVREHPWDIIHYVGHGGRNSIRLNPPGDTSTELVSHDAIAQVFSRAKVRLVVLNCCRGAESSLPQGRKFGGLGNKLRQQGVPAVVAMRYDIEDGSALKFAGAFYKELFGGESRGRVDTAFNVACDSVHGRDKRAPFTPALYLARGFHELFTLQPAALVPPLEVRPAAPPVAAPRSAELEAALTALKDGRCLVLAGPGILRDAARTRDLPGGATGPNFPPLVDELAGQLALHKDCPYPRLEADRKWCAEGGDAYVGLFLQWVCQHFQSQDKENVLADELRRAYADCACPAPVRAMARWRVPALIYTFVDGALERQADTAESFRTQQIVGLPLRADPTSQDTLHTWRETNKGFFDPRRTGPASLESRLLVLARGSLVQPESLRVSEQDNEALLEQIGEMSDQLASFIKESPTRSLFVLGADPSDPLVHRLTRKLLFISGEKRQFGPTFLAWPDATARDRNYWRRFKAQWLPESLDEVIRAVSQLWP